MAIVLLTIVMPLSFLISCNRDKKEMVDVFFDPQTSYTFKEMNVETLVSDSGVTKYRLKTQTQLMFGKASDPYSFYPDGIYLEKFDTAFNIEASLKADTAYHYERRKLWEANGNVDMTNLEGHRFQTSQVFWDQQNKTIYSNSFIRFTKGEMVQTGSGFHSNEDLSVYTIFNATAEIPIETQRRTLSADSIPPDTLSLEDL
jgi:LPS export ABC transporter protein LptC